MYMEGRHVQQLCEAAAQLSAPGSVLAVTLVNAAVIRRTQASGTSSEARKAWKWGTDEPEAFFLGCGWRATTVAQPGEPAANYGRWTQAVVPREPPPGEPVSRTFYCVCEVA